MSVAWSGADAWINDPIPRAITGGRTLSLLARTRSLDSPPADRAGDEDVMDGTLERGGSHASLAQFRQPLADLFLVRLVRGIAAHDAQRDGLDLGQLLFHLLIHAFIVMPTGTAMQGRDAGSIQGRNPGWQSSLRLALQSGLRLESFLRDTRPGEDRPAAD